MIYTCTFLGYWRAQCNFPINLASLSGLSLCVCLGSSDKLALQNTAKKGPKTFVAKKCSCKKALFKARFLLLKRIRQDLSEDFVKVLKGLERQSLARL